MLAFLSSPAAACMFAFPSSRKAHPVTTERLCLLCRPIRAADRRRRDTEVINLSVTETSLWFVIKSILGYEVLYR